MPARSASLARADELCRLSARDLAARYRKGSLSPVEAVDAALQRAEELNPSLNAFTFIDREGALRAAAESERRWSAGAALSPIDGVPATIKDIVWVEGWPTRYGSATTPEQPCAADAPSTARLRKAGAIMIGQTTTPEFGWKAVTDSPLFGITRNPWNPGKTPGGSSGGAAVAAASGAGVLHLGTDGGGSIRIPASFTGIVGHKPTFGRVPAYPASAFGSLAHIGPMARSVADAQAMLYAMSGRDLRDWAQGAGMLASLKKFPLTLPGLRVGYWSTPAAGNLDQETGALVGKAVETMAGAGVNVEPVDLPGSDLLELFHHYWFLGAAARTSSIPEAERALLDPGLVEIAGEGAGYGAVEIANARTRRIEFGAAMDRLLAEFDFLVSPATAIPAFDAGCEVPAGSGLKRWTEWAGFNFPINLSQQPATVIPCALNSKGLPIGLQVVGARGNDARVLAMAEQLELLFSGWAGNGRHGPKTRVTEP